MPFINPIEILELSSITDASSIDNETIKKAKRKLFADIELSDSGTFNYYGLQLTKGNCEKAIDELTNETTKEFYLFLAKNKPLNEFLVNGNIELFNSFKQESIYKLKEFIDFVSPYYAPKFDKALSDTFEKGNTIVLSAILNTTMLISLSDLNTAYKSVVKKLDDRINEVRKNTKDINEEQSEYSEKNIPKIVSKIEKQFPYKSINLLPNYFQSQILKIAEEINYLNLAIWENLDNPQVCEDLLSHVLKLNIDGLNKPTFQKNYEIVRERNQERIEEEKNRPVLLKYSSYVIEVKNKIDEIENRLVSPNALLTWLNNSISIDEINALSDSFIEIKNMVALLMRAMSVAVWNTYSNIDISIELINKGFLIKDINEETKEKLILAKKELIEIKQRSTPVRTPQPNTHKPSNSNTKTDDTVSGLWVLLLIVGVIVVLFLIFGSKEKPTSYNSQSTPAYSGSTEEEPIIDTLTPASDYEQPVKVVSKYLGNQLNNGASPLKGCFGKGKFGGQAYITFKNSNSTDAIVCLVNVYNSKTIRNEYIRAGQNYTMRNIPSGTYFLKVYYGNDWNPKLENFCGTKGAFESDVHYSKSPNPSDFISIENSEYSYTTGTITLYSVQDGNMSTQTSSEEDFFNN